MFRRLFGMESHREVQLMMPLSGRTYLDAYYKLDKPEGAQLLSLVDKFAAWLLIVRILWFILCILCKLPLPSQALASYALMLCFPLLLCIDKYSQIVSSTIVSRFINANVAENATCIRLTFPNY